MSLQASESSAETVADCSHSVDDLTGLALSGEAVELYRPLVVGTDPAGPSDHDRGEIAAALEVANQRWQHPRAEELAATLAQSAARVVVTGQQPGIFGGPLLTLVKALAASLWADKLTEAGTPAVAVFWVAGEDHDFHEVSQASWLVGNDVERQTLGEDDSPLAPVGARPLGGAIEVLLARWADSQSSDFWRSEAMRLARYYDAGASFTDSFAGYLAAVLGRRCPLLLDAQDAEVKRLQRPLLQRLVDERGAVEERLRRREQDIEDAGFGLQVASRPDTAPLFVHQHGRRRRIRWRDDGFALSADGPTQPVDELERMLTESPSLVSASALARPPIQDALLGTSMFVVGPGELAYLAQSAPLYDLLEITPPTLAVRPTIALAAQRKLEQAREIGLPVDRLVDGDLDVTAFLADRVGSNPVPPAASAVDDVLNELRRQLLAIEPTLEDPWDKTRDNVVQALQRLESKAERILAQRDQVTAGRVRDLDALVRPGGEPQERTLSTAWALGRFGDDLPARLADVLDLTPGRMQVIAL